MILRTMVVAGTENKGIGLLRPFVVDTVEPSPLVRLPAPHPHSL